MLNVGHEQFEFLMCPPEVIKAKFVGNESLTIKLDCCLALDLSNEILVMDVNVNVMDCI